MDFKGALRARALADVTVAGMIGTRAYWTQRIQSEGLPAVVFHIVSDQRPQHMKGFNDLRETRVQCDCLALSDVAASDLLEALIAALVPENTSNGIIFNRSHVDDGRDGGDAVTEGFIHRTSVDLRVWWQTE